MIRKSMQSPETSGAGATGFGADKDKAVRLPARERSAPHLFRGTFSINPVTAAVAVTAFVAASLFVIYDSVRTLDDASDDLALISEAFAEELADVSPDAVQLLLESIGTSDMTFAEANFLNDVSEGSSDMRQAFEAVDLSGIDLANSSEATVTGIAQRGAMAFGLAVLLVLIAWRGRSWEMPDFAQRYSYETLAESIPMGIACWTKSGRLVVCNAQYRERLSLTSKSMTYHEAVSSLIAGGYMKLLNDDDSNRLLELHRNDGSCLMIDERPMRDGGFMTLVTDVTERKQADLLLSSIREEQRTLARRYHEEKLKAEAASRAKTNFLAHLSHDIRTPLNHIIGFAELMRHQTYGPLGDARYGEYVQSIKSSGEHLLNSFATILDLAELESGQKTLRSDPVPLDELLNGIEHRYAAQAQRANLEFLRGEPSGAVVRGDRLGLTRMIGNVVENSIRFTPAGGQVTLAAYAAPDGVVIEITDTGLGMTEERLASLSQPFALGDATFTREGAGPGLGISISRAIAELSGGHMAIDSSPSLGTTVAISLPLQATAVLQAAE